MGEPQRTIVAMGGDAFSEPYNPLLDEYILGLARERRGRGNTANMLAVWRTHGFDRILAHAWAAGVVLAGTSAGSNCWFEGATTDSFGPLAALPDGLGFLPGSHSPHYDSEPGRRPTYQRLVAEGALPDGYAADDSAGLVFHGTELAEVVASRPKARAYRVVRGLDGQAVETELAVRYLG